VARQRLGQHFLSDPAWQSRILAKLPRAPHAMSDETWVEIGAGHGELTRHLAQRSSRVIAVETDPPLAEALRANAAAHPAEWPGVEVAEGDVLTLDLAKLTAGRFHVYGNLPYYITSPILHHLFQWANRIVSIHIVIQLEVAERIAAKPGVRDYGYFSAACQFYARPEIALKIPAGAFRPPPKVTSALVNMSLPGERAALDVADEEAFLKFIQVCFAQKRKTLRNNLLAIAPDERIREALATCGLEASVRAEQLSLPTFAALNKFFGQIPRAKLDERESGAKPSKARTDSVRAERAGDQADRS
jgi:16S rRNA (adenine1518-N6/adenine1519-N6)-dimethyltransferase